MEAGEKARLPQVSIGKAHEVVLEIMALAQALSLKP
jgi:hypothetical protein